MSKTGTMKLPNVQDLIEKHLSKQERSDVAKDVKKEAFLLALRYAKKEAIKQQKMLCHHREIRVIF